MNVKNCRKQGVLTTWSAFVLFATLAGCTPAVESSSSLVGVAVTAPPAVMSQAPSESPLPVESSVEEIAEVPATDATTTRPDSSPSADAADVPAVECPSDNDTEAAVRTIVADDTPTPASAPVAEDPNRSAPTAAFLDLDGSPLGALLEQRLLENPRAVWLERNAIEAIQKEQELAGLMAPAAGQQRVALGKLLKADVLVLLRAREKPAKATQLVVCETTHGLRLLARTFSTTEQSDTNLQMLGALVDRAIEKQGETIKEIVAVPPFVSRDLSFRYGYLQGAYAKLVEQTVADLPGILLVELDEARAIARELTLVADTGSLRRPLPLYVMGEFRHERDADPPRVNITLEIYRGEEQLAQRSADIARDTASIFLQKAAGELIGQTVGVKQQLPDPKQEAKLLADRANEFRQLEQWEETASLLEAALLLDNVPEYHERAARAYSTLAPEYTFDRRRPWEERVRGLDYYLCGLDHLEKYIQTLGKGAYSDSPALERSLFAYSSLSNTLVGDFEVPDEFKTVWEEEKPRVRETLTRILRNMVHSEVGNGSYIFNALCKPLPRKEQFNLAYRFLIEFQDVPAGYLRIWNYAPLGISPRILNTPEGEEFLVRLESSDNDAILKDVAQFRRWLAMFSTPPRGELADGSKPIAKSQPVQFTPIEFPALTKEGDPITLSPLWCCIPAGPRMEITLDEYSIYAIEKDGPLKTLWKSDLRMGLFRVTKPVYDGRFVWVPVPIMFQDSFLLVLDPQSGETWKVTNEDGLPLKLPEDANRSAIPRFQVAAVAPGRVCVAGKSGRSWIAMVDFDPLRAKPAKVEVIHEARIAWDRGLRDTWMAPDVIFEPSYMMMLTDKPPGGSDMGRHVLIGRSGLTRCPLLVNPETQEVSSVTPALPLHFTMSATCAVHQGAAFYPVHQKGRSPKYDLYRVDFPELDPRKVLAEIPYGRLASDGKRLHVISSKWWRMREDGKGFELLGKTPWYILNHMEPGVTRGPETPFLDRILFSRRYGFLVGVQGGRSKCFTYQVTFDDPADSLSRDNVEDQAESSAEERH